MPSRTIDYTAMWRSGKLEDCPIWARREYPWVYGLADVNGSFEISNVRALWMDVAPIRPDLDYKLLQKVLQEYHAHGLLFTWQVRGKAYAHWTGSNKPGRLPRLSVRKRFRWLAPSVPKKALRLYVKRFANKEIRGDVDTRSERVSMHAPGVHSKGNSNSKGNSKGKGKGKHSARRKTRRASSSPATQAADGTIVPMPLAFKGKSLLVTKLNDNLLDETFGHALNMHQIYKQADLWLVQTSKRRPNVLKFLSNWCKKELRKTTQQHSGGYPVAAVGRHDAATVVLQDEIVKPIADAATLTQARLMWEDVKEMLREKINRHTYDTWFAPLQVWDWDEDPYVLTLQAPSKMILHWLENEGHAHVVAVAGSTEVCYVGPDGKEEAKL